MQAPPPKIQGTDSINVMHHFDELAHRWESPKRRERAQKLAEHIRTSWGTHTPRTLFDFGSGTGLLSLHFIDDLDHLYAYDPSEGMRDVLTHNLAKMPEATARKVSVLASMDDAPAHSSCEAVLASQVLHHIDNARETLLQLASLLAPGGSLTVIDFVAGNGFRHPGHHHHGLPHHGFDPEQMMHWMGEAGLANMSSTIAYEGVNITDEGEEHPYRLFLATGRGAEIA